MSTTVWTLIPNQYERDIYLVLSDDSFYNIVKLLNKKYEFDWEEDTDFSKNDNITPPCTISNGNKFKIAIALISSLSEIYISCYDINCTRNWSRND